MRTGTDTYMRAVMEATQYVGKPIRRAAQFAECTNRLTTGLTTLESTFAALSRFVTPTKNTAGTRDWVNPGSLEFEIRSKLYDPLKSSARSGIAEPELKMPVGDEVYLSPPPTSTSSAVGTTPRRRRRRRHGDSKELNLLIPEISTDKDTKTVHQHQATHHGIGTPTNVASITQDQESDIAYSPPKSANLSRSPTAAWESLSLSGVKQVHLPSANLDTKVKSSSHSSTKGIDKRGRVTPKKYSDSLLTRITHSPVPGELQALKHGLHVLNNTDDNVSDSGHLLAARLGPRASFEKIYAEAESSEYGEQFAARLDASSSLELLHQHYLRQARTGMIRSPLHADQGLL